MRSRRSSAAWYAVCVGAQPGMVTASPQEAAEGAGDHACPLVLPFASKPLAEAAAATFKFARVVYADGSAPENGNPAGPAGLGVYWGTPDDPRNLAAPVRGDHTNNVAELEAIEAALDTDAVGSPSSPSSRVRTRLVIATDSQYCLNALTVWYGGWVRRGWLTASGEPVKNQSAIQRVKAKLDAAPHVTLHYVPGHKGHKGNEAADRLAAAGAAASAAEIKAEEGAAEGDGGPTAAKRARRK